MSDPVTAAEFRRQLVALCLGGGGYGLPSKRRHRCLLLQSFVLALDSRRGYSEPELADALATWKRNVARSVELDHVALRRHLVDERFLVRDAAGHEYRVGDGPQAFAVDPEVRTLDPKEIVERAIREREERRERFRTGNMPPVRPMPRDRNR